MNQNKENILSAEEVARRHVLKGAALLAGSALLAGLSGERAGAQSSSATNAIGNTSVVNNAMPDSATMSSFGITPATMQRASGGPIPGLQTAQSSTRKLSPDSVTNDIAILNSALLLEYLEADFYARVVAADEQRPYLPDRVRNAARTLRRDEATHVMTVSQMIRQLGGVPLQKPQFQFPANVFISSIGFLTLSVRLEENGVGAYLGAAPQVKSKDVLNFAASIYGNETRHTGLVRYLLGGEVAPRDLERPITIEEATANAAPYIVKDSLEAPDTSGA